MAATSSIISHAYPGAGTGSDYARSLPLHRGTLSALSLPSFARGIAGVARKLPLGFHGGFPRCLLSEFRIAGLLLGFQRGLTSGSLSHLRSS